MHKLGDQNQHKKLARIPYKVLQLDRAPNKLDNVVRRLIYLVPSRDFLEQEIIYLKYEITIDNDNNFYLLHNCTYLEHVHNVDISMVDSCVRPATLYVVSLVYSVQQDIVVVRHLFDQPIFPNHVYSVCGRNEFCR